MKGRFKLQLNQAFFAWLLAVATTCGLLCYRLGSLLPGLAAQEETLPSVHSTLQTIWYHPLALPVLLSRLLVAVILPTAGAVASRLPSILLAIVLILSLYWLLRRWYGYRLALFGSILAATAPWFLHVGRLATNDIMYPLTMTLLLCLAAAWHQKERTKKLLFVSTVLMALLVYVPGAVWLLGCVVIFERQNILATVRAQRSPAALASLVSLVVLAPMIHALVTNWHLIKSLLGLPTSLPLITEYVQQFGLVWWHIFVRGYNQPVYNLGRLAIVNLLIGLTFVVGLYLYGQHPKASRTRLLASLWVVGTALVALGMVHISLILPIVLILATGGIGYLLHLWLRVFPRNPLARGFGIGLVGLVIAFAVLYNMRNYYVAWPLSPTTKHQFQQQR